MPFINFLNSFTMPAVLLIVSVLLLAAAIFVYFGYLKITAELYERVVAENEDIDDGKLPESPYVIKREYDSYNETNKYRLYKGSYTVSNERFESAKKAQKSLNELEQLEGYKRTKVV